LLLLTLVAVQVASVSWAAGSEPSVWIAAPENGTTASIGEILNVFVVAADDVIVSTIALTCDGRGVGMTSGVPATLKWDTSSLAPGAHTLRVKAVLDSGTAISSDPVLVTLTGSAEVPVASLASMPGPADVRQPTSRTNLGVGFGIPYGVIGLNVESGGQTCFSGGLGWGITELAWNVGVKQYFRPLAEGRGSGSISAYYGTNTYLLNWGRNDELLEGFSVGLGWTSGHFDIGAIVPFGADVPSGTEELGSDVKLYIGYRFGSTAKEPRMSAPQVERTQKPPPPMPTTYEETLRNMRTPDAGP